MPTLQVVLSPCDLAQVAEDKRRTLQRPLQDERQQRQAQEELGIEKSVGARRRRRWAAERPPFIAACLCPVQARALLTADALSHKSNDYAHHLMRFLAKPLTMRNNQSSGHSMVLGPKRNPDEIDEQTARSRRHHRCGVVGLRMQRGLDRPATGASRCFKIQHLWVGERTGLSPSPNRNSRQCGHRSRTHTKAVSARPPDPSEDRCCS